MRRRLENLKVSRLLHISPVIMTSIILFVGLQFVWTLLLYRYHYSFAFNLSQTCCLLKCPIKGPIKFEISPQKKYHGPMPEVSLEPRKSHEVVSQAAPPTSVTRVQLWPQVVCRLSFSRSQSETPFTRAKKSARYGTFLAPCPNHFCTALPIYTTKN